MSAHHLTAEMVRSVLDYEPSTGVFRFKVSRGSRKAGDITGQCRDTHGYPHIRVFGRLYLAHRLAWLHYYGEWPPTIIDHINRDQADNRIENLRLSNKYQNAQNKEWRPRQLPRGVYRDRGAFRAQFMRNGRRHYIGTYKTPEEAHAAYLSVFPEVSR